MKLVPLLLVLVLLAASCSRTEKNEWTDPMSLAGSVEIPPDEYSGPEENAIIEAEAGTEAVFPVFSSLEELTDAIRLSVEFGLPENERSPEARVELWSISRFPMLSEGSFPSYRLFQIEVMPDFLCFYYVPEESGAERFDAETSITVTTARKSAYTLESLAAQSGIVPDTDGFLRDEARSDLSFEASSGSSLTTVHVPPGSFDLETLRSRLEVLEVEIPAAAEKKTHWGEFELFIPEGAEEIRRSSVPDPAAGSSLGEVVFLYGGDTYTYRSKITGGLENISPFPDDYVRGEHDDLIPPETPRCICDRAEGSGVLLWLCGDRMFSLSMTEGADGEKLTSMRLLLTGGPEP